MWLAHNIRVTAEDWRRQEQQPAKTNLSHAERWEKLEGDLVKANCDAAFNPNMGNGGWGYILQDSVGDVVVALWGRTEALLNSLHSELIACIQGTQAAVTARVGHVIIEMDVVAVVKDVYSDEYDLTSVSNLVKELRSLLAWNFISRKVQ